MEIKVIVDDTKNIKASAVVINFFEGMKSTERDIASIDKALAGAISKLVSKGEIK